ncbi:hypothetical protein [Alteromonas facilis]|uniref:hypothetical protein n=1 Tax=Alteromonas facilis TaxID=2048004 RepID=UPI000C286533|nr:hypothetical protein [Alteromonas facilis]
MRGWLRAAVGFFIAPDKLLVMRVSKLECQSVSIFGAGDLGLAVYMRLEQLGIQVNGWYDSKVKNAPCRFIGIDLLAPCFIKEELPQYLVIASEAYAKEIMASCVQAGFKGRFITL